MELAAGVPVSFVCESRRWNGGVTPVHWFERVAWWQTARRAPRGSMFHIDVEAWQVQARIGHSHRAPVVTSHFPYFGLLVAFQWIKSPLRGRMERPALRLGKS